ncbi:unnamed protein product [Brassicogethes aeneus]|uniref:Uncharacterized protein n=1 Tax=Brassicogethes aeneus TaxID=1431903 RepID=A0A9P0FJW5_BRAAE|nr:unnamed protein product [Brassicogethes aeneus]
MKTTVKISHSVIKRISEISKPCHGKLFGSFSKNNLTILALQVDIGSGNNLVNSLPAEIDFCGIFHIDNEKPNDSWIREYVKDVDVTDNPIFINVDLESKSLSSFIITSDKLEVLTYTTLTENDINSQFLHLLLRGNLPLKCEANKKSVEETFAELRKIVTTGKIAFNFEKHNIFLLENEFDNPIIGISGESIISELCSENNDQNEGNTRKKKNQTAELQILNVNFLRRNTKLDSENDIKNHAPICIFSKKQSTNFNINLDINTLSIVNRQTKISKLYGILVESTIRHLRLYESVLLGCLSENEDVISNIKELETFHFYTECGHFVSKIYPKNLEENQLKKERQLLHEELLVKTEFPKFRRANMFDFDSMANKGNSPLINPHESVKITDNGGHLSLVKG